MKLSLETTMLPNGTARPRLIGDGSVARDANATEMTFTGVTHFLASDMVTSMGNRSNVTDEDSLQAVAISREQQLAAILVPVFFGVIFCVGLVGNALVITVITKIYRYQPHGMTNTNRFILNLAISDMFFLFFCVPFQAPFYSMDYWPFGSFMCVFCEVCQKVTMLASVYTLVALSFDRFFAVVYATSAIQLRTKANAYRGIIFIWVVSCGIGMPSVLTRVQTDIFGPTLCIPSTPGWNRWYQLTIFLLGYVIPLAVILSCYVGVLVALCKNEQNWAAKRNKNAQDSRKRVTRIVVAVVVIFAADWFLHHMMTLWRMFGDFPYTSETYVLTVLAHCLSYANSCVNPLVYAFVSKRFRNDFKRACTCQHISEAMGSIRAYSARMVSNLSTRLQSNSRRQSNDWSDDGGQKPLRPRPPIVTSSAYPDDDGNYDPMTEQHATSMFTLTPALALKNADNSPMHDVNDGAEPSSEDGHRGEATENGIGYQEGTDPRGDQNGLDHSPLLPGSEEPFPDMGIRATHKEKIHQP